MTAIPFTDVSGSTSITASEFSLPGNTTSGVPTSQTTYVDLVVMIDASAMAAGDQFDLSVYEKVNAGTQAKIETFSMFGVQGKLQAFGPFRLHDGWDVTLKKIAGTNRTIGWSLREDLGNRNISSTDANAITSSSIAANAIGASQIADNAIDLASLAADAKLNALAIVDTGTAQAGAATTITLRAGASATDNLYNGNKILIASGTGAGQSDRIKGYVGSSKVATMANGFAVAPDNTSVYVMFADSLSADLRLVIGSVINALVSGRMDSSVGAIAASAVTSSSIASGAITAAKFATDAIDANALKADAVTEIQSGLATAANVTSSTSAIAALLPSALVGGRIDASVGAMAANVLTATAIASNAITAAKIATDAIGAAQLAADAVTEIQTGLATSSAVASVQTDTTSLVGRLTALRAGYLDNLNIGGNVASSAEATSIQNNTRTVRVVPDVIERPDSGTATYRIELFIYDEVGNMEAPDSAPTLGLVNQSGTDLSLRLDSTTMAIVGAEIGHYRSIYTASVGDALEQLVFTFLVVEGGATRKYGNTAIIVDTTAVDFTAADRAKLNRIDADYTTARAAEIDNLDVALSSRASATSLATAQTAITAIKAKTDNLPAAPADESLIIAATNALATAIAAVQSDTDDLQSRIPAALDGSGFMKSQVKGIDAGAVTAMQAGLATSAALASVASAVTAIGVDVTTLLVNLATAKGVIDTISANLILSLGLAHLNARIDTTAYGSSGVLTSARLRVFADSAALAASVDGHANGADSEINRYTITAVDNGTGGFSSYKLAKDL